MIVGTEPQRRIAAMGTPVVLLVFDPDKIQAYLTKEEYNLYKLIFDRFVGSQMKPALFDVTDVDVQNGPYTLRASGEVLRSPGFLAIFQDEKPAEDDEEKPENAKALPAMNEGDKLELLEAATDNGALDAMV